MNHLALIIPTIDKLGGAERQVLILAKGMLNRGWRVNVVALSGSGGAAAAELLTSGVGFLSLHMRKGLADPRGWIRFNKWLRIARPDIVHAHLPHAAWMARWSRLCAPSRVVVDTIHSPGLGTLGRRLAYRCSRWLPDKVTAVSHSAADAYSSARMVSNSQIVVLPNGIDTDQWRPDPESHYSLRNALGLTNEFLWLAAGRLDPVKDYQALLHAMTTVSPPAQLVIAGAGPLESDLRLLAHQLDLEQRVRFLGFEPNVLRWMQAADGFVLSSWWEGLSMALLEACSCALPLVASDVPGNREVIISQQSGLLATVGDVNALASAMTQIMTKTPKERLDMGLQARNHVLQKFSLNSVLDRWETLYTTLLDQHPHPTRFASRHLLSVDT